jgi:hypothetical protein
MGDINLINLFDFYLAAFFLLSTARRWGQYQAIVSLLRRAPGRWPKLMAMLNQQRYVLLNRAAVGPVIVAFVMMSVQIVMSRLVLPEASVTLRDLREHSMYGVLLIAVSLPMIAVDAYFLIRVGTINESETSQYLDRAESWLANWKSTLIRVVTFGRVNPRQMVEMEVRKALQELRKLMARNFYWMALQYTLRVFFGLTLWGTWGVIR